MKKIIVLFLFLPIYAFALELPKTLLVPKSKSHIKLIVNRLDAKLMESKLRSFVKCCRPSRMVGTSGHKDAVPYLIDQIKKSDKKGSGVLIVDPFKPDVVHAMEMYQEDFKREIEQKLPPTDPQYKKWKSFTDSMVGALTQVQAIEGRNIIWEKKGFIEPNSVITIGAHFDTIAHDEKTKIIDARSNQPGADDNGSAVALALGLIEVLSALDLPKTVRVVFFDYEEMGFLGSRAYIRKYRKQMKKQKFAGFVNLEMLGHDSKRGDKEKKYGNFKAYIREEKVTGHAKDKQLYEVLNKAGKDMTSKVKFKLSANGFKSSDHINFWGEGFAAVTFTQNWESDLNPRYHSSDDFPETLNLRTWYASYQYITGATLSWAFDILK
ncbi:MAG: hypothetical protein CME70_02395 [Halobacteriovorax sp.]|nr:hypothetical protein [Halobacteriovorax sp.]|tara:strand:- start:34547 stop:35686 length:1140 start_codon:yes stop_codon:yes gene_type:complete